MSNTLNRKNVKEYQMANTSLSEFTQLPCKLVCKRTEYVQYFCMRNEYFIYNQFYKNKIQNNFERKRNRKQNKTNKTLYRIFIWYK